MQDRTGSSGWVEAGWVAEPLDAANVGSLSPDYFMHGQLCSPHRATEVPADAAGFVRAAQDSFNARDAEAATEGYRDDALLELWSDGVHSQYRGRSNIRNAWAAVFTVFPKFRLCKALVGSGPGRIVNTWAGTTDGRRQAFGIDLWELDDAGKVSYHRVLSFGAVMNGRYWWAWPRWALFHPAKIFGAMRQRMRGHL